MPLAEIMHDIWDRKVGRNRFGNLVIKGGVVIADPTGENVSLTANISVTQDQHGERDALMMNAVAGLTATLPIATGSGAKFRFVVGTTLTSNSYIIKVAQAADYIRGKAWLICSANAAFATANTGTPATESDTVTMNGTTTGGLIGDVVELTDIAANVWQVEASLAGSGTAATPFSVTD